MAGPSANASNNHVQSAAAKSSRKSNERFSKRDIEFILTWLENPPNFKSIFGSDGRTAIGSVNKPRTRGYNILAQEVSKQSQGRIDINGKNMRERFNRHMKIYKDTKRKADATGFGVTDEDAKNGIYIVAHKLESMCTGYGRMDALFGLRTNVASLGLLNSEGASNATPAQGRDENRKSRTAPQRRRRLIEEEVEEEMDEEMDEEANKSADSEGAEVEEPEEINGDNPEEEYVTDSESQVSNKRSRATDRRKRLPSLEGGSSPEESRREFISSYEQSPMRRFGGETIEEKKLKSEKERLDSEDSRDRERLVLERQRMKMEAASRREVQEMENKKLKMEVESRKDTLEMEYKKLEMTLEIEKRKLEASLSSQRLIFIQAALERGQTAEQIEALISMAFPSSSK